MKAENLKKKLAEAGLLTKQNRVKKSIIDMEWYLYKLTIGWDVHPLRWTNRGRTLSGQADLGNLIQLLDALGVRYIYDNDAPKGGQEGWCIKCKDKRQAKKLGTLMGMMQENKYQF